MPTKNPKDDDAIKLLGRNVRKIRITKGLTMVELAEACNIDYRSISNVELATTNATISMIFKIAKGLGVKPSQLLEE